MAGEGNLSPHVADLAEAMEEAYLLAQAACPHLVDELYIHTVEVDGQYVTVTVGVSNITDFKATVEMRT